MAQTITLRAQGATRASEARLRSPLIVARFQVFHFAGMASGNPFGKMFEFGSIGGGSDARKVEAGLLGGALDDGLYIIDGTCQCFPLVSCF